MGKNVEFSRIENCNVFKLNVDKFRENIDEDCMLLGKYRLFNNIALNRYNPIPCHNETQIDFNYIDDLLDAGIIEVMK